jgi:D-serine deaminase-like pyridoxal phosphate-dependent protein
LGLSAAPALSVLGVNNNEVDTEEKADQTFRIGDRVLLWCQHACITASAFPVYFVADEKDIVREAWAPWKGW